jgi:hypothetical protein
MPRIAPVSLANRRRFLTISVFALVLVEIGCGEGGVTQATDPPTATGNRARLNTMKQIAEENAAKSKK